MIDSNKVESVNIEWNGHTIESIVLHRVVFLTESFVLTIESNAVQIKLILITTESFFLFFLNRVGLVQSSRFFQLSRFIKIESTTIESILSTIDSILSIIESILETYTTHFWINNFETNGLP